jgi:archaellum component FlaF (FlaF/FlaG flagellin family)
MDSKYFSIILIITALIVCGGVYSVNSLNLSNSNPQDETQDEAENEAKVVESIENVSAIENQKIINITNQEIELENGNKFKVSETGTI